MGSNDVNDALDRLEKLSAEDLSWTSTETFASVQQALSRISSLLSGACRPLHSHSSPLIRSVLANEKVIKGLNETKKLAEDSARDNGMPFTTQ